MKPWIKIAMLFAVVIIGAWYAFRPERLVVNRTVNEALPTSQGASSLVLLESGTFYSILHPTQGAATIYQLGDGARGLYYAATAMESLLCREREIIVVGGGNSAGQAAVYLSGVAKHVHLIIRGPSLASTMSQYLISRIERSPRITLYTDTEIERLEGVNLGVRHLDKPQDGPDDAKADRDCLRHDWRWAEFYGAVKLDKKGFVLTGRSDGFERTPYATNR